MHVAQSLQRLSQRSTTPVRPSISTSSWFSTRAAAASPPPLLLALRRPPTESNSSKNSRQGAACLQAWASRGQACGCLPTSCASLLAAPSHSHQRLKHEQVGRQTSTLHTHTHHTPTVRR